MWVTRQSSQAAVLRMTQVSQLMTNGLCGLMVMVRFGWFILVSLLCLAVGVYFGSWMTCVRELHT
jgi:hypothetical protein